MTNEARANTALIERFYAAFSRRDAATMSACYAADARFTDPVFDISGAQVPAMWSMLCERAKDLQLTTKDIRADAIVGSAHWEPRYTFSATGRRVVNVIDSAFTFRDGLIATHVDHFDLWRWSRMALGLKGTLLGWMPGTQKAVRARAQQGLNLWMEKHAVALPAA